MRPWVRGWQLAGSLLAIAACLSVSQALPPDVYHVTLNVPGGTGGYGAAVAAMGDSIAVGAPDYEPEPSLR